MLVAGIAGFRCPRAGNRGASDRGASDRRIGNRGNEAYVLNYYAATIAANGDRPRALMLYQQALAMNRELNKPDDEAVSLEGIAEHDIATGDLPQSAAHLRQALDIYQRLGMRAGIQRVTARLAETTGR